MYIHRGISCSILAFAVGSSAALAGPDWPEINAGSFRPDAEAIIGVGPLAKIIGTLSAATGDFEDMYLIKITDPANFTARTDPAGGGFADFNTMLWLFRPSSMNSTDAFGLLGNDDATGIPGPSFLMPMSTAGPPQAIPGPGLYLLAITGFNNVPLSAGGEIFFLATATETSGPDGPGGLLPHTAWTQGVRGVPQTGSYEIALTGAAFVEHGEGIPAASDWGLIVMALTLSLFGVVIFRRRGAWLPAR